MEKMGDTYDKDVHTCKYTPCPSPVQKGKEDDSLPIMVTLSIMELLEDVYNLFGHPNPSRVCHSWSPCTVPRVWKGWQRPKAGSGVAPCTYPEVARLWRPHAHKTMYSDFIHFSHSQIVYVSPVIWRCFKSRPRLLTHHFLLIRWSQITKNKTVSTDPHQVAHITTFCDLHPKLILKLLGIPSIVCFLPLYVACVSEKTDDWAAGYRLWLQIEN